MDFFDLNDEFFEYLDYFRSRGRPYLSLKKHKILRNDLKCYHLNFFGTYTYDTLAILDTKKEKTLSYYCSCPYYEEEHECKHVWALFQLLSKSELLKSIQMFEKLNEKVHLNDLYEMPKIFSSPSKESSSPTWEKVLNHKYFPVSESQNRDNIFKDLKQKETIEKRYCLRLSFQYSLSLYFEVQQRLKSGRWGKLKHLSLNSEKILNIGDKKARELFTYLYHFGHRNQSYNYYYSEPKVDSIHCDREHIFEIMAKIEESGVPIYILDSLHEEPVYLQFELNKPYTYKIEIEEQDQKQWQLSSCLIRENDKNKNFHVCENLTILNNKTVSFITNPDYAFVLENNSDFFNTPIPPNERDSFLKLLISKMGWNNLILPESIKNNFQQGSPTPELHLYTELNSLENSSQLVARAFFSYENTDDNIIPNSEEENTWLNKLHNDNVIRMPEFNEPTYQIKSDNILNTLKTLQQEGWSLFGENKKIKVPKSYNISVSSGEDWFELTGDVNFEIAHFDLPDILKKAAKNQNFIPLSDGSIGILPKKWLEKQKILGQFATVENGKVTIDSSSSLLLEHLLDEQIDKQASDIQNNISMLNKIKEIKPRTPSKNFQGTLRDYQKDGLGWMHFLQKSNLGGCLADDMGLGKTIQVLAHLQKEKNKAKHPHLIVAPVSLLYNWSKEFERFSPETNVKMYTGNTRKKILPKLKKGEILLTTYGVLRQDILTLKEIPFDYIILDEAQNIKNSNSKTAKSSYLLQGNHRLALTGTPVENHLGELFSIFRFLLPGLFGKKVVIDDLLRQDEYQRLILESLRPFILRRKKQDVLAELPEKEEHIIYCEMDNKQAKKYHEVKEYYRILLDKTVKEKGILQSKVNILEGLLRLRQLACHPALIDNHYDFEKSAKLEILKEYLPELQKEGHKVLLFSQFTSHLKIVAEYLNQNKMRYCYLDGSTRNRADEIQTFKENVDISFFLISLKAGGSGLNLTEASYCFLLDPWWNPAVEAQAIDRIHRIGQKKQVTAYRLITKDTIEEKIINLQNSKREVADFVMASDGGFLKNLTPDGLSYLFE